MSSEPAPLLALDLTGTFAFGLNGALTAVRAARLDVVGVVVLGMITALGGGVIRDVLIDSLPPATLVDWRFYTLAAAGGLIAFALSKHLRRIGTAITVLDALGLSAFAVIGASKALQSGLGVAPAVLLGVITAVGGGTIRDTLVGQVPSVLRSGLYAIPALVGASVTVATIEWGVYGLPAALGAALTCFLIRMIGIRFSLNAPEPPETRERKADT
ncbi:trimeric intracellular cation channel family protein [Streptomyces laculatispora]|uniref:trimeric intracellular cation channel family protein n=1 Tax=Streptomyces laculatispora TaxID=887464 RepID=UPI001A93CEFA|nr:trimeric intracellular cation channel family protein [Streptomyces laculatispora]MBO0913716.1 trimeric intracellular cation channel family protein [Streptomyces laculatispora]